MPRQALSVEEDDIAGLALLNEQVVHRLHARYPVRGLLDIRGRGDRRD